MLTTNINNNNKGTLSNMFHSFYSWCASVGQKARSVCRHPQVNTSEKNTKLSVEFEYARAFSPFFFLLFFPFCTNIHCSLIRARESRPSLPSRDACKGLCREPCTFFADFRLLSTTRFRWSSRSYTLLCKPKEKRKKTSDCCLFTDYEVEWRDLH